ncbi:MAG: ankyrin repeat domain-containing protein, partial [Nevskiaceae bacterium]|nr:ankyrin repeat domain-containing protein [Nevskiaceae bacterium]
MNNVKHLPVTAALAVLLCFSPLALAQSSVADAAMNGDAAAVQQLLKKRADVNAAQNDGATALHWAAYHGDGELTKLLLKAGANPNATNRNGSSPMWLAAMRGDAAVLKALLDGGASANEEMPLGRRPLMLAARAGSEESVRVLLDHQADINARETERGTSALMQAADQGHAGVIKLLISRGADVGATSAAVMRDGRTAALGQATDPRKAVRRQVISVTCKENAGTLEMLRGLALGGDDPLVKDANDPNLASVESICTAADKGFFRGEGGLRGPAPARPREPDGGALTALVYAARTNAIDAAQALLDGGADVNQTTRYGWSPLLAATQNQNYQMAKFLIEHGADVNLANKGGWTPLYLATDNRNIEGGDYPTRKADMDSLEFIKLLLDKGAKPNARVTESTETRTVFT